MGSPPGHQVFALRSQRGAIAIVCAEITAILLLVGWGLGNGDGGLAAGAGVLVIALLASIAPQRYVVGDGSVRFRSGLLTLGRVDIDAITQLERGRGWPPSHTLRPLDGIDLCLTRGKFFAIPRDEVAFVAAIVEAAPRLAHTAANLELTRYQAE